MPRLVSIPHEEAEFIVIYDFAPMGYGLERDGRLSKPTGAAATGTWTAYRLPPDGMLKTIPGKGILKRDIQDTILRALARAA